MGLWSASLRLMRSLLVSEEPVDDVGDDMFLAAHCVFLQDADAGDITEEKFNKKAGGKERCEIYRSARVVGRGGGVIKD
jgi:hypothetical protein